MKKTSLSLLSIVPLLLLLLVYAGDTYHDSLLSASLFFFLLGLLTLAHLIRPRAGEPPSQPAHGPIFAKGATAWWIRVSALLAGGLLWLLLSDRPYQMMLIFPRQPTSLFVGVAVIGAILGLLLVKPLKPFYAVVELKRHGIDHKFAADLTSLKIHEDAMGNFTSETNP